MALVIILYFAVVELNFMQEDYQNSEDNNEEEFEDEHIPVHPESLGRGQKIAAAILAVFGWSSLKKA